MEEAPRTACHIVAPLMQHDAIRANLWFSRGLKTDRKRLVVGGFVVSSVAASQRLAPSPRDVSPIRKHRESLINGAAAASVKHNSEYRLG